MDLIFIYFQVNDKHNLEKKNSKHASPTKQNDFSVMQSIDKVKYRWKIGVK